MSPKELILTALLLGAFVLCAGGFGSLQTLGRVRNSLACVRWAGVLYVSQCFIAIAIALATPLASGWKSLIVVLCIASAAIPRITLRHLEQLHK